MIQVPEAPLPPPHLHAHPSPQHLPAEMERLNLDHGVPPLTGYSRSHNPSFDGRLAGPGHQFDTSLPFDHNGKVPVTFEGWSFMKQPAVRPDQKETWALVVKTPMPESQTELRERVTKQKKKGKSAADQLASPDMNGYKRKQVERLIADRARADPDSRFEYKLAALKLGQGSTKRQGRQTNSMQVILKRLPRNGLAQPSSGYDRVQDLDGEIVDLTGAEDTIYSENSFPSGISAQHAQPGSHGFQPPFVEHPGGTYIYDPRFGVQPVSHAEHNLPPHHGSPPMQHPQDHHMPHHDNGFPPEAFPLPDMGEKTKEEKKHDKHDKHGNRDKHDRAGKKDKPKIHQKKDKKGKSYSDTSSDSYSDADSFASKTFTDQTPDTVYSGGSRNSYHKDKKYNSGRNESRRGSHAHHRDRSPTGLVYRERHRKSPIPLSRKGSTRYDYEDYDIITSERDLDRDRAYKGSRKSSQGYRQERSSAHPRALSYDDDRHHRPTYGLQRKLQSYAHPAELHAEKQELMWEIEEIKNQKVKEKLERERAERDRQEVRKLERERLQLEIEREKQERDRADRDRLDRLDRERYEKERLDRERMDRDRYGRERMDRDRFDRDRFDRGPYNEPPQRYPMPYETRRDDAYYRY